MKDCLYAIKIRQSYMIILIIHLKSDSCKIHLKSQSEIPPIESSPLLQGKQGYSNLSSTKSSKVIKLNSENTRYSVVSRQYRKETFPYFVRILKELSYCYFQQALFK